MDSEFALFAVIGFAAQIVDGALGMAFGVISSTSLIALGLPPALASAAVHAAEVVTTGISGISHLWNRNVDRGLFLRLLIPGILGGLAGAYVVTIVQEEYVRPIVTVYLAAMAILVFLRVAKRLPRWQPPVPPIGATAGFLDAFGGGGWGPLASSTLMASGDVPRTTIGSVNSAEFFITAAVSVMFLTQLDLASYSKVVLGLIVGGALAAPLAGYLIRILPPRAALVLVGIVVAGLSGFNIYQLFNAGS